MEPNKKQKKVLESLGAPTSYAEWAALDDETFIKYSDAVEDSMLYSGVNDAGDGLNEYGEICHSILVDIADL